MCIANPDPMIRISWYGLFHGRDIPTAAGHRYSFTACSEMLAVPNQVRDNLAVLAGACDQLTSCSDFMVLLQAVLSLGNHLNEGTMRGAASGQPLPPPAPFFSLFYLVVCKDSINGLID